MSTETPVVAATASANGRDNALSRTRRVTAWLLVIVVMGAVASMSWAGLYGFAHQTMRWSPAHAVLVPIALDVAAVACALLALDTVTRNDSATSFRLITAALVGLSAFVNWRHALGSHNVAEQVFFPAMSVLSYLLVDAVIRKTRRDTRRDRIGHTHRAALEPLPKVGMLAWLRFPGRAFGATSDAIAGRLPATTAPVNDSQRREIATAYLAGLSQAECIRRALAEVGDSDPREVVAWLERNGRPGVATQRVYDVLRRDRGKHAAAQVGPDRRPALTVAGHVERDAEAS